MNRMRLSLSAFTALALLSSACASSAVGESLPPATDASDSIRTSTTSASTSTISTPAMVEGDTSLPTSKEPCTRPADHTFGELLEYSFVFRGSERPVYLKANGPGAIEAPTVRILMHAAGIPAPLLVHIVDTPDIVDGDETNDLLVLPQAASGDSPFWTEDETFNADYVKALLAVLEQSVCLEDAPFIRVISVGQGSLAASQALCAADLPIDHHLMYFGLLKVADCRADIDVPILSLDPFDFDPALGHHWDGEWLPPGEMQQDLVGGSIGPTPMDLAVWAQFYGCTGSPTVETIDGVDSFPERPTEVVSYVEGCAAPLIAYGLQNDPTGALWDNAVYDQLSDRIGDEIRSAILD